VVSYQPKKMHHLSTLLVELPNPKTVEDCKNLLPWRLDTAER
jgi:hypothetical protein